MNQKGRKITIGRDRDNDIPLGDESVSARHAEVTFLDGGRLLLTDCQSTNGTFLITSEGQSRQIRQSLVSPSDRVRFGAVTLGMRELLDAWRARDSGEVSIGKAPADVGPSMVQGRRLIRCLCGCVKPEGMPCPECGG